MLNKPLSSILFAVALMVAAACSGTRDSSPADSIDLIEAAVSDGMMSRAREMADRLTASSASPLSTRDLCRLSIAYMKISEVEQIDINTALATRCYRRAMAADPDSATAYYESLPLDESRHVHLMAMLEPLLSADRDNYYDVDSLPSDHFYEQP